MPTTLVNLRVGGKTSQKVGDRRRVYMLHFTNCFFRGTNIQRHYKLEGDERLGNLYTFNLKVELGPINSNVGSLTKVFLAQALKTLHVWSSSDAFLLL